MKPRELLAKYIGGRDTWEFEGLRPIWDPPEWQKAFNKIREKCWQPKIERVIGESGHVPYDLGYWP